MRLPRTRFSYDGSDLLVGKDELDCAPRAEYTAIATTYVRDPLGQLTEKVISRVTGRTDHAGMHNLNYEDMDTNLEIDRLIGQQLCSVLTAIDHISLKFVKYPLSASGEFPDSALMDIKEGYSVTNEHGSTSVRSNDGLDEFRQRSIELIKLIGATVTEARIFANEEIGLEFDSRCTLRLLMNEMGFDSFRVTYGV